MLVLKCCVSCSCAHLFVGSFVYNIYGSQFGQTVLDGFCGREKTLQLEPLLVASVQKIHLG